MTDAKPQDVVRETGVPKIYQALCRAIKLIGEGGLKKEQWNEQQRYWFRGIDDIYNCLNPVLAKFGLVIVPSVDKCTVSEYTSTKGTKFTHAILEMSYVVCCAEDGSSVVATIVGEALDTGDKAVPKALSMAYKSMAIELFCIPIEIDDDADAQPSGVESEEPTGKPPIERPKAVEKSADKAAEKPAEKPAEKAPAKTLSGKPITAGQAAWITKRVTDTGSDMESILKTCGVAHVGEIDGSWFSDIRKELAAA